MHHLFTPYFKDFNMLIIGISAFYHDSAAAIVRDGEILAAAQEERFTRKKHDPAFPSNAVKFCLHEAGATLNDVDFFVFYDKPFLKFERLLETYLAFVPRGLRSFRMSMPLWLAEKLGQKKILAECLGELSQNDIDVSKKILFSEHHISHSASAFFPSPFEDAVVLSMDGVGEWATTSVAIGTGNRLEMVKEIHFPHSLGLLYSAFTSYAGFKVNSGEYKLMGLSPYGVPKYANLIMDNMVDVKEDGSFMLDQSYFNYCVGLTMTSEKFHSLFGLAPRNPEEPLTQYHMDIAASIQSVTEKIILRLTSSLAKETGKANLCLAGGVALNCVANGKILKSGDFTNIWIQPASGDSGGAIGAALGGYYLHLGLERKTMPGDSMKGSYLGPSFTQPDIEGRLAGVSAKYKILNEADILSETAQALADGKVVGWFQGRMEFGPRALGNRSILADPRSTSMQKTLNLKIKYRESFRPFAPSVLREDLNEWFDLDVDSPYMLLVGQVKDGHTRRMTQDDQEKFGIKKLNVIRSDIPSVTHVDYSARVQTVHRETNLMYYGLITKFKTLTGCPILVNTSFNVRGEPIVCTPEDAFRCFMGTEMDVLVVGNCFLEKKGQDPSLKFNYKDSFKPD